MPRKTPIDLVTIAKKQAKAKLNQAASVRLSKLVAEYPQRESETWAIQLAEAQAYTANPNTSTPFINAALNDGETVAEFAVRVIAKSLSYSTAAGEIVGMRRRVGAKIDSAETIAEVDQALYGIDIPT